MPYSQDNLPPRISVLWSKVNQAWLVVWSMHDYSRVLRIFTDKNDLNTYLREYGRI